MLVESRSGARPQADDEQPIIRDEASLKIRIDSGNFVVKIEREPRPKTGLGSPTGRDNDLYDSRPSNFDMFRQERPGEAVDSPQAPGDPSNDLKGGKPSSARSESAGKTGNGNADLDASRKVSKIYGLLDDLQEGYSDSKIELSVVVCLVLENGVVLDVARFGDFATPGQRPEAQ